MQSTTVPVALPDPLLTPTMLKSLVPVSDAALDRWIRKGAFPAALLISGRRFWRLSEVENWLAKQSHGKGRRPTRAEPIPSDSRRVRPAHAV